MKRILFSIALLLLFTLNVAAQFPSITGQVDRTVTPTSYSAKYYYSLNGTTAQVGLVVGLTLSIGNHEYSGGTFFKDTSYLISPAATDSFSLSFSNLVPGTYYVLDIVMARDTANDGTGEGRYVGADSFTAPLETNIIQPGRSFATIYPNPFNQTIAIHSEQTAKGILTDATGRTLQEFSIHESVNEVQTGIMPTGIYFLSLFREGEEQKTIRIVKQ